jgi:DNA-binding MarR family transcriptional regulator
MHELVREIQRLYPQIYLACHVDHVRGRSTEWRLSARDSSVLAHLDRKLAISPRRLAAHLSVASSTLSATIARLENLGYLESRVALADKRQRELRLTVLGAEAMASTSVLDRDRVKEMVGKLNPRERRTVKEGFALVARAARAISKRK